METESFYHSSMTISMIGDYDIKIMEDLKEGLPRSCNLQDVRLYHNRYLAAFLLGTRWR